MTARERAEKLIKKQPVPTMGYSDKIWPEVQQRWIQEGNLKKTGADQQEFSVTFDEYFQNDFREIWNINTIPFMGQEEILEQTEEWKIVKNGAGAVFKYWKYKSGTPEHIDFSMNSFDTWKKIYKPQLEGFQAKRCDFEGSCKLLENCSKEGLFSVYGNLGIWELLRSSLGDVCMFESLLDDPEWIEDFNQTYINFFIRHLTHIFDTSGVPDAFYLYDDLAYNKGLFCSPELLRELFLPYYQKLTDFLHSYNVSVIFHCCGNAEAALPLIVESGFDALNPMEVKAGCDVVRFAEKYGESLAFIGGFDVRILENGDRSEIKKEVLRITNAMRHLKASYFFGTDHSVSPNVRFDDYEYAVKCFKEYSYY